MIDRSMSQSRKKKTAPAVVSTGCGSGLMSCLSLSLHRRAPTPPPPPPPQQQLPRRSGDGDDDAEAEQYYWERVQFLEEEIRRLGRTRLAPAQADQVDDKTSKAAAAGSSNAAKAAACGDQESTGTGTATTKRCVSVGHGVAGGSVQEMTKLEDGSYLHEIGRRRVGARPWERLAVQVSQPVVPADAATASEVLDKMTMGKAEDMCRFLAKMMPMKDIAGRQRHHKQDDDPAAAGETVRRRSTAQRLRSGSDFTEAVLFHAMDKMEGLILEGLKIQMSSSSTSTAPTSNSTAAVDRKRNEGRSMVVVHVVLIQVRDPEEGYGAVGDPMIGLLEASLEKKDDGRVVKVEVQGLHVAGIVGGGSASWTGSHGSRSGLIWSASRVECDSGGTGDGRRCSYVRNPNRVFQR